MKSSLSNLDKRKSPISTLKKIVKYCIESCPIITKAKPRIITIVLAMIVIITKTIVRFFGLSGTYP